MAERCPNCEHASGYYRTSSEDWRCRRCGYIWAAPEEESGGGGPPRGNVTAGSAQTPPGIRSAVLDLESEEGRRLLRQRAEDLAQEDATYREGDTRLLALFSLGEEWYAVDVASVREIRREFEVTRVPGVGGGVRGVINLRGEIISATDLAVVLDVDGASDEPVMMICDLAELTTGLMVDRVADVVEVPQEAVEPPLATLERGKVEYTEGQVAVEDRLVTILDLNRALAPVGG